MMLLLFGAPPACAVSPRGDDHRVLEHAGDAGAAAEAAATRRAQRQRPDALAVEVAQVGALDRAAL